MSEKNLAELIERWNQGDESALVTIYDEWGERIIRAVYQNSRVAREGSVYGSSDMCQTVLRWMLMYSRSRQIYATRPEHVEALFRTFVKRALVRADRKARDRRDPSAEVEAVASRQAESDEAADARRRRLDRARKVFSQKDWEAVVLVARGVPQRVVAELQKRSYQYLRLQLARRRAAARRELAK